jgi:hypothetical protein
MKKNMLWYSNVIFSLMLSACSSTTMRVVEQSDSRPSWATITRSQFEEDGKVKFVGYFTSDDARPSAVVNGSAARARAMPLASITNDFLDQVGVEEDLHDASSKMILSTLRKDPPQIPGLQVVGNFYERVEIPNSDGTKRTEIRAYSLAECPTSEYLEAKKAAIARLKGDSQVKHELNDLMSKQRERVYGDAKPVSNDRTPASAQTGQ